MAFFGFGKKKEEKNICGCSKVSCESGCTTAPAAAPAGDNCQIKVLGSGCKNCHTLLENTKAAVAAMGLHTQVAYITDMEKIMTYGAMQMPALVVNEQIVSMGRVLKPGEIEKLLHNLGY